tara:strand:+ start:2210 stop:3322 length:1113 start_codon:yes stop_codon:yes gene_type:complete
MENNESNAMLAESMGYKLVDDNAKKEKVETAETAETVETTETEKNESTESVDKESSLKENSDTPKSSESKSESPDLNTLLREKSEGKFESYEDLIKSFEENQSKQDTSNSFANETIAKMNEYVLNGGKIDDFNKTQIDYSEMSDLDIVKSKMKIDDSDLSDSDVDFMINNEYTLDEEEYDEDEVRISKLKLRKDAKKYRQELQDWQEKFKISEKPQNPKPQKKESDIERQKQKEFYDKERVRWSKVIDESVSNFDKIDFDINDKGEKFTFTLSDDDRTNVKKSSSDLSVFWKRFMNEDGTENVQKLNEAMFVVDNFDKIVRAVANQYKSTGKDDVLKDIKNPDYNVNSGNQESGLKSLQQQMYDAWQKGN